jgi:hypothetical protein
MLFRVAIPTTTIHPMMVNPFTANNQALRVPEGSLMGGQYTRTTMPQIVFHTVGPLSDAGLGVIQ